MSPRIFHYTAFADAPRGGNPAGVIPDASGLSVKDMQTIATELGYPESAFVTAVSEPSAPGEPASIGIRYFTPGAEIPFCGHATVATAVHLASEHGWDRLLFQTAAGEVSIATEPGPDGAPLASFTSVEPSVAPLDPSTLGALLDVLSLTPADLHPDFPALESFAGNRHPMLVVADRGLFHQFRYDPRALAPLMAAQGWNGTVTVLSPLAPDRFEARNLFPVGRLTEDPATGSAAAATGAYLRHLGRVPADGRVVIHQGAHVGRPSLLTVTIPDSGGITVTGGARAFTPGR